MSDIHMHEAKPCTVDTVDLMADDWKCWCRLCARANTQCINIISGQCPQPMGETCTYSSGNIAPVIEDFFRVYIKEDEKLSQLVCTECYQVIDSLVKFRERVNKVQQMYDDLLNHKYIGHLNTKVMYEKYGLIENEPFLRPVANKLPVEEIFVDDLPIATILQPSGVVVKSEKKTDETQTEIFLNEYEKEGDFVDPIGDTEDSFDPNFSPAAENSESSDDSDDDSEDSDGKSDSRKDECEEVIKDTENNSSVQNSDLEVNYTCKVCSQSFQHIRNYSVHMKKKHKVIICPDCPDTFKNAYKLKLHMKTHPKSFECPHCDKKFVSKVRLVKHTRSAHEEGPPLICEVCGATVRTKAKLKEHMLQHTDYAPFDCKVCGMCFKVNSRLRRHMQIHGEKLICPECGKQLSSRATLKSHLLVHSDKMSHKCDFCGRLFKRAATLKNHLIAHTDIRPYSCNFCDKTFSTGPSCRFHKKTMHPMELAELEASGAKAYTKNVPTLQLLKAVSKTGKNLKPLASKQNGLVHFDRGTEESNHEVANTQPTTGATNENMITDTQPSDDAKSLNSIA